MLSPKTQRNIFRIIPFGLIWLIFSIVYSLLERGILGELTYYPSTGNPYNFTSTIFITAAIALVFGLMIGTIEILYLHDLFIKKNFTRKIVYKTIIYLALIICFLLVTTMIYNAVELEASVFSPQVLKSVWLFFSNYAFWGTEVYITSIIGVSLFYNEVSENLGLHILNNFLTGKYHSPVEEERIFMFLDLKSSTTIAERLGHLQFFEMLRTYYADLTDPIIMYAGEVYQYAGDEIIVSWKVKKGVQDNNCIACFFAIKAEIKKQAAKYHSTFGFLPEFKAGLHVGNVTTGEIGAIKKDIFFTGDVLNTTSRIQGLCNSYNVDLLISDQLMQKLYLPSAFQVKAMGESTLRGRDEKIKLFTIALS